MIRYITALIITVVSLVPFAHATTPNVGDQAPLFVAQDSDRHTFNLKQAIQGSRYVVLVFYPQDGTSVCTEQLCALRDLYPSVPPHITMVGISGDSAASHQAFATQHQLPFPLLIDESNKIRDLYRAYTWLGTAGRVTIIIDHSGTIVARYANLLSSKKHIALIQTLITKGRI